MKKKVLMLLCITTISLLMVVTVTAQSVRMFNTNGSHSVGTLINEQYNNLPTTFTIAPGFQHQTLESTTSERVIAVEV